MTTNNFAFDDSTDYYKLEGLGRVCEMGDAMVASALQGIPGLAWHAIRNASDPQIPNPNHNIEQADQQAAQIYARYGGLTTAGSVIATWAVIHSGISLRPEASSGSTGFKLGRIAPARDAHGATTYVEPIRK